MALHQTSGRTTLGLSLALSTALLWATLPVGLKFALEQIDALTLTWFRFVWAFLSFGAWLAMRRGFSQFRRLDRRGWGLLLIAAVMLTSNYVCYLFGLDRTTPANSQLLMQLAPLLMATGGIVVFRERFTWKQRLSTAVLVLGLSLFFWDQLTFAVTDLRRYLEGSAWIVTAAATWAVYALVQKQLLVSISSIAVLFFLFAVGSVALLPMSNMAVLADVDAWHWLAIAFCSLNTLAAYGAFAESLAHADASRVGVVLALNPLLTLAVVGSAHWWSPTHFPAVEVALLGYLGAALAVTGSIATSWLGSRRSAAPPPSGLPAAEPVPASVRA